MTVKIRLARLGCKHRPFYRLVAADDKSRRDGKQIEVLGFFDPLQGKDDEKRVSLKYDRIKYWLSVGAQPTDTVENMLFRAGLIPPKAMVVVGSKNGQQSANLHVSPITGEVLN
uniref:30S ribosomal protein S16 n=2 Tax=Noccaea caerulescens TaxID=107243 RepID=A0A1J3FJI0_NOCCA